MTKRPLKQFTILDLRDAEVRHNQLPDGYTWDNSGYGPFLAILESDVDPMEKVMADKAMRQIIQLELTGNLQARVPWESAFLCYKRIVLEICRRREVPFSTLLLASQIEFLVAMDKSFHDRGLMQGIEIDQIIDCKEGIKTALHADAQSG